MLLALAVQYDVSGIIVTNCYGCERILPIDAFVGKRTRWCRKVCTHLLINERMEEDHVPNSNVVSEPYPDDGVRNSRRNSTIAWFRFCHVSGLYQGAYYQLMSWNTQFCCLCFTHAHTNSTLKNTTRLALFIKPNLNGAVPTCRHPTWHPAAGDHLCWQASPIKIAVPLRFHPCWDFVFWTCLTTFPHYTSKVVVLLVHLFQNGNGLTRRRNHPFEYWA